MDSRTDDFRHDAFFGSEGSFFDWTPSEGNFELNPPFCIQSTAVEDHVLDLLNAAEDRNDALSFVYVVPETATREATRRAIARSTRFLVRAVFATKDTHVYRRGNSFMHHACQPWSCPLTTVITFLQTSEAKKKWPVTDDFARALQQAFAG